MKWDETLFVGSPSECSSIMRRPSGALKSTRRQKKSTHCAGVTIVRMCHVALPWVWRIQSEEKCCFLCAPSLRTPVEEVLRTSAHAWPRLSLYQGDLHPLAWRPASGVPPMEFCDHIDRFLEVADFIRFLIWHVTRNRPRGGLMSCPWQDHPNIPDSWWGSPRESYSLLSRAGNAPRWDLVLSWASSAFRFSSTIFLSTSTNPRPQYQVFRECRQPLTWTPVISMRTMSWLSRELSSSSCQRAWCCWAFASSSIFDWEIK